MAEKLSSRFDENISSHLQAGNGGKRSQCKNNQPNELRFDNYSFTTVFLKLVFVQAPLGIFGKSGISFSVPISFLSMRTLFTHLADHASIYKYESYHNQVSIWGIKDLDSCLFLMSSRRLFLRFYTK
jgi:hypothetical protein